MWRWRDDDFEQKSLLTTYQVYNIVIVEFATSMVMPSTLTVLLLNVVEKHYQTVKKFMVYIFNVYLQHLVSKKNIKKTL